MRHLTYEHSLDAMTRLLLTLLVSFVPPANADYLHCRRDMGLFFLAMV